MTTEEKQENGMRIYTEYRRKYYEKDFFSKCEQEYVTRIIEACELNFYNTLIPMPKMYEALDYCERAHRAVRIVLDAQYLSGEELEAYRERYKGNKFKLRGAGRYGDKEFGRSYHIEYDDRPLSLLSQSMQAFLEH